MDHTRDLSLATTPDYQVRLEVFEGPLDLLLFLVRKEEVELYDLSLERLTRQYLAYLAAAPQPDLDVAGDFIAMAAHLIYLKSRRLLPPEQVAGTDDAAEEEDPHWELIRQLVEYKKFKDAAGHLQAVEGERLGLFPRQPSLAPEVKPDEETPSGTMALGDVGVFDLLRAFQRTLKRLEEKSGGSLHGDLPGLFHRGGQDRASTLVDRPSAGAGSGVHGAFRGGGQPGRDGGDVPRPAGVGAAPSVACGAARTVRGGRDFCAGSPRNCSGYGGGVSVVIRRCPVYSRLPRAGQPCLTHA